MVGGKGFEEFRAHGIDVEVGLLEDEALRLNRAFTIVQTEGRPMVIAKAATSLDSRIAAAPGVRTQLTSAERIAAPNGYGPRWMRSASAPAPCWQTIRS